MAFTRFTPKLSSQHRQNRSSEKAIPTWKLQLIPTKKDLGDKPSNGHASRVPYLPLAHHKQEKLV